MAELPPPVQRLMDVIHNLPGVLDVGIYPKSLDGTEVSDLSLPGEFGDLPQVAIMRTEGGRPNEQMVIVDISFQRTAEAWLTLEFLSWWVRDSARSGDEIQLRCTALPPKAYEIQLGRTLKILIEHFFVDESEDWSKGLAIVQEMAESIQFSFELYAECFESPAEPHDPNSQSYSLEELHEMGESDGRLAYQLAEMYFAGDSVEPDETAAIRWMRKSAELGNADGQFRMGRILLSDDENADPVQALEYLKQAAKQEHPLAIASVGECYLEGWGVEKDEAEGFRWYTQAAETGDPICLAELGDCLELGKGCEVDLPKALELYVEALELGFDMVQEAIERTKNKMGQG